MKSRKTDSVKEKDSGCATDVVSTSSSDCCGQPEEVTSCCDSSESTVGDAVKAGCC